MNGEEVRSEDVFERALEDLSDDAYRKKGGLPREHVDQLYLRRGITPDQAVAIERALAADGVVIIEETPDAIKGVPEATEALSSSALDSLIAAARRHPLLTQSEEIECGEAIQTAFRLAEEGFVENEPLAVRVMERADAARAKLIARNILLVVKLAFDRRFRNRLDADDLVQTGIFGLMRAADKFDPEWGCRFSTYAVWWIRQAMARGVADTGTTVRVPVYIQARISRYRRARRQLGFGDTYNGSQIRPIAEKLAWTEEFTAKVAEFAEQRHVSLDAPITPDGETSLGDLIPDEALTPEEVVIANDTAMRVRRIVEELDDERLEYIIAKRFGFDGPAMTLQEIGDERGVTRERIRQLEERALRRLRLKAIKAKLGSGGG